MSDSLFGVNRQHSGFPGASVSAGPRLLSGGRTPSPSPSSDGNPDTGKFDIDLTRGDLGLGDDLENAGDLIGGLAGGVLGAVGSIGLDEDHNLGAIPEAAGDVLGDIGRTRLPGADGFLPVNPTLGGTLGGGGVPDIGAIPGAALDILGLPVRALERTVAEGRIKAVQAGERDLLADVLQGITESVVPGLAPHRFDPRPGARPSDQLPTDIMDRLESGDLTIAEAADELVGRSAGFTNDPVANLASGAVFDPMNLIGGAVGKGASLAQRAGLTVGAGLAASPGEALAGSIVQKATHGLTALQQSAVRGFVGPATSGVFHALGSRPYTSIAGKAEGLAPEFGSRWREAFAAGAAQLPRAVIGHQLADEAANATRRGAELADGGLVSDIVEARLGARRAIDPAKVERDTEELLLRVAPDFPGRSAEDIYAETVRKLAGVLETTEDDARAILGDAVDLQTARTVHLAYYGAAGRALVRAKNASEGAANIDVGRLTLIAPDTLTVDRAEALTALSGDAFREAAMQYGIIASRYAGTAFDESAVREFVGKLASEGALPSTVKAPTTGADALPGALGAWRQRFAGGYDLGFAPEGGWKVVQDADGNVIAADPFVHFVDDTTRLSVRNPLGRFVESLFRGQTQHAIILDAKARLVAGTRGLGISPNEARAILKRIFEEARSEDVAPRGLLGRGAKVEHVAIGGEVARVKLNRIDEAFRAVLGDQRFGELIQKANPTVLALRALEGNLSRVGLTQKLTGKAKTLATVGPNNVAAAIAEDIYPTVRFRLNPLFQLQELTESPFLNLLRGVTPRAVDPDVAKAYNELGDLPEFRYISEAGYFLNLGGSESLRRVVGSGPIGVAMQRFPDVKAAKEGARLAQVMAANGEAFRDAVAKVSPKAWQAMREAYGTSDPATIADRFVRERLRLTSNAGEAMRVFDGIPGGGTIAEETVWQAFRESFRQATEEAFRTHFFDPKRGWLERTLNHPFLGLYPLSYMRKVTRELARFLIVRPFGKRAPLTGLEALHRTQQDATQSLLDPETQAYIRSHPEAVFLMQALLPAVPTNIPVNAPGWARTLAQRGNSGKPVDADTVAQAVTRSADYAFGVTSGSRTILEGVADLGEALTEAAGDLYARLDKAATEYDAMHPIRP